MKKIIIPIFTFILFLTLSLVVLAADTNRDIPIAVNNTNEGGELIISPPPAIDDLEEVTATDLNISEPKILPNSPWYWAKSLWRSVKLFATLDPLKKAEKRLQIANERLIELKRLAEAGEIPEEQLEKILSKYDKEIEKLKTRFEKIKEKRTEKANQFLDKLTKQEFLRQRLMERLKERLKPEVMERFKERSLEKFGEILNNAQAAGNKIEDRINNFFINQDLTNIKNLPNLEVLTQVLEKVPDQAKEAVLKARSNALKRLGESFRQMTVEQRMAKVEEFLKEGSSVTSTSEILEEVSEVTSTPKLKEEIKEIREKIKNEIKERTQLRQNR